MKYICTVLTLLSACIGYAQSHKTTSISGIIISNDSVPVPDVAIINTRTLKTVRTDNLGFFQTTIEIDDSLLVHHIAYKRIFIKEKNNGKYIVIEPQIHELQQVDIKQDEYEILKKNLANIKELARQKKLSKEEVKSLSQRFTDQNGSHNKGFSSFFGPTTHVSFGKVGEVINRRIEKRYRQKLTSHYHLVKKKPGKKERVKFQKNS